jgi:hypothetical protein
MEQLALAGGMDTALRRLSKGNLQKVALAQALLVPPRLLVLDEPWSGLDVSALVVLACCLVLDALVLAVPVVFGFTGLTGLDLVAGGEALLTGACAGIAIGLLTSRLVIRRIGFALLAILVLFVLFLVVPWLPPVHPVIFLLAGHASATGGLIASTSAYTAIAVVMLVASVLVTQLVAARRD